MTGECWVCLMELRNVPLCHLTWDENDGMYIIPPNPNKTTTEYRGSNGHKWRVEA